MASAPQQGYGQWWQNQFWPQQPWWNPGPVPTRPPARFGDLKVAEQALPQVVPEPTMTPAQTPVVTPQSTPVSAALLQGSPDDQLLFSFDPPPGLNSAPMMYGGNDQMNYSFPPQAPTLQSRMANPTPPVMRPDGIPAPIQAMLAPERVVPNLTATPGQKEVVPGQRQDIVPQSGVWASLLDSLADPGVAGTIAGVGASLSPEGSIGRALGTVGQTVGQSLAFRNASQGTQSVGTALLPPELQAAAAKLRQDQMEQELDAQRAAATMAYQQALTQQALAPNVQTFAPGSYMVQTNPMDGSVSVPQQVGEVRQPTAEPILRTLANGQIGIYDPESGGFIIPSQPEAPPQAQKQQDTLDLIRAAQSAAKATVISDTGMVRDPATGAWTLQVPTPQQNVEITMRAIQLLRQRQAAGDVQAGLAADYLQSVMALPAGQGQGQGQVQGQAQQQPDEDVGSYIQRNK